jgi:hypothetical protein
MTGRLYRNEELAAFISGSFKTAEEQRAAWEAVRHIRETYPDAERALRGKCIGVDELGD